MADIHGNLEALNAILEDIKKDNFQEIYCLGDIIGIGSSSKECIDLLIENNVKSVLGDYEIYLLRENELGNLIDKEKREYINCIKESLNEKEINYIKSLPLYYDINVQYDDSNLNKKYVLCHYLIADEKAIYPFEKTSLKDGSELWKKYNSNNTFYIVGHIHNDFDIFDVDGIVGDYIDDTGELVNIDVVESAGILKNGTVSYLSLEIGKNIKIKKVVVNLNK